MMLFKKAPDGGKDSGVTGYFLVEIKPLFSIVLLHFKPGTREAFHSHAFNAITWWLKGAVEEHRLRIDDGVSSVGITPYGPSWRPKFTTRDNTHKVFAVKESWALSFRGPWVDTWKEYLPSLGKFVTLTHGRRVVGGSPLPKPEPKRLICGFVPPTPGYAPCTRDKGHDGPCAHDFARPRGVYPKRAWF